ncbi:hypothetical protein AAC387_Pa12g0491 [Persea americana]
MRHFGVVASSFKYGNHYSGNKGDVFYDWQYMEIQNLRRQIETTLAWRLDRIKPRDQFFHESAYEADDDLSVHSDRSNDNGDFDDPLYDDESDEDHHDKLNAPIWDVYGDDNDVLPQICDMYQDSRP